MAGGWGVQSHPQPHNKFKGSLGYLKLQSQDKTNLRSEVQPPTLQMSFLWNAPARQPCVLLGMGKVLDLCSDGKRAPFPSFLLKLLTPNISSRIDTKGQSNLYGPPPQCSNPPHTHRSEGRAARWMAGAVEEGLLMATTLKSSQFKKKRKVLRSRTSIQLALKLSAKAHLLSSDFPCSCQDRVAWQSAVLKEMQNGTMCGNTCWLLSYV